MNAAKALRPPISSTYGASKGAKGEPPRGLNEAASSSVEIESVCSLSSMVLTYQRFLEGELHQGLVNISPLLAYDDHGRIRTSDR